MRSGPLALALAVLGAGCRNFEAPPATLAVSPARFSFTARANGDDPPPQPLLADLRGSGRLVWLAEPDVPWIRIAPAADTAPAVAWVTTTPTGLSPGVYTGRIVVTAGSATLTIPVTFAVTAAATLTGRWAFLADTINVGLTLADSNGVVTGSGNFNAPSVPRRFFSVQGTAAPAAVTLTLTQTDSTRVTLSGSLFNDNLLDGVLSGGNFAGARVLLFRQ